MPRSIKRHVKRRFEQIGDVSTPAASAVVKAFITEMLKETPFEKISDPARRAEMKEYCNVLTEYQTTRAFLVEIAASANGNMGVLPAHPEPVRTHLYQILASVNALRIAVHAAVGGRNPVNIPGEYLAQVSTAEDIDADVEGLQGIRKSTIPCALTKGVLANRAMIQLMALGGTTVPPPLTGRPNMFALPPHQIQPTLAAPVLPPTAHQQGVVQQVAPKVCTYCHHRGHLESECRKKRVRQPATNPLPFQPATPGAAPGAPGPHATLPAGPPVPLPPAGPAPGKLPSAGATPELTQLLALIRGANPNP